VPGQQCAIRPEDIIPAINKVFEEGAQHSDLAGQVERIGISQESINARLEVLTLDARITSALNWRRAPVQFASTHAGMISAPTCWTLARLSRSFGFRPAFVMRFQRF
jgi:hypothetical protein